MTSPAHNQGIFKQQWVTVNDPNKSFEIDTNFATCFAIALQSKGTAIWKLYRRWDTCTTPAKHVVGATPLHAHYATAIYVD